MTLIQNTAEWKYFRENGSLQLDPDEIKGKIYTWKGRTVWDTGLECRTSLPEKSFIACVAVKLEKGSFAASARVLVDGAPAGLLEGGQKPLEGCLEIPAGVYGQKISLILYGCMKPMQFAAPQVFGAVPDGAPTLWPTPKKIALTGSFAAYEGFACPEGEDKDAAFAAQHLTKRMQERGLPALGRGKKPLRFIKDTALPGETYRVSVTDERILLSGNCRRSLLYAAELLLQLMSAEGIRKAEAEDAPFKPFRGFHFGLPPRGALGFTKELLRTMLLPLHFSQLIVEFAGGMRFDSHPEIADAWIEGNIAAEKGLQPPFPHGNMVAGGRVLEKAEVADLLEYAREYGFEIVPEVQTWSHTEYLTYAHPELAELPHDENGQPIPDTVNYYPLCFCPSDERCYQIIFELAEEILELARPERYLCMGHDEIWSMCQCPKCRDRDPAEIFETDVRKLHAYAASKGLKLMLWSDSLQPTARYAMQPAGEKLPKDILFGDFTWYYNMAVDIEDNISGLGHPIVMANLYSSHYPRYESRIRKPCFLGGFLSTWCNMDEATLSELGKLYDICCTAEMLWSESYRHEQRRSYAEILHEEVLPRLRRDVRGEDPEGEKTVCLPRGVAASLPPVLRKLCPEAVMADGAEIPVGKTARKMYFRQTVLVRRPVNSNLEKGNSCRIGTYTVCYADGTQEEVPVIYGRDVLSPDHAFGEPQKFAYYRHHGYVCTWSCRRYLQGKDERGCDVLLLAAEWKNPHPEKVIERILCREDPAENAGWVTAGAEAEA